MEANDKKDYAVKFSEEASKPLNGDEVVITGISGIFPCSDNIEEFMENLYNKVDMVTEKFETAYPDMPEYYGKIRGVRKFDPPFFKITSKQATAMDPMCRKLLEQSYGAIFDAGINPLTLKGKRIGVFMGVSFADPPNISLCNESTRNKYIITGNGSKTMYANRITYWIDSKGPSCNIDCTCSSSMACLDLAYLSIMRGESEAAIVGSCNLCIHENITLNLRRLGHLSPDGKTKSFDKNGDGYGRSEAVCVIFLQRAKDAKRIYMEVCNTQVKYNLNSEPTLFGNRNVEDIVNFLKDAYTKMNISPKDVEYVEGHGTGQAEGDRNELKAISEVFGDVKIGCVKSNMGHSEGASGMCAVAKMCLAYYRGALPPSLRHTNGYTSNTESKILYETSSFKRKFTAINNFSFSGVNTHVLLKGHAKKKPNIYKCTIPRLVFASGRTKLAITMMFDKLKSCPIDSEQIGLLNEIHRTDITGHTCRGYTILDTNANKETISIGQDVDFNTVKAKPVWFLYSGMGSQWPSMGKDLMSIPIFAEAVERCHKILHPRGVDIFKILTTSDKTIFDNILNSFVGIAAVQIGLTDVLRSLDIVPDNIIGHSVGELGCAYADGCFTTEEMILAAYSRGSVSVRTPFIHGTMAAVGLGHKLVLPLCPPGIEIACHNSSTSSTLSGPTDTVKKFVASLRSKGIFAKEVPCSNIAYHSRYIAHAGPALLSELNKVIKTPKRRSRKWICTSLPPDKWEDSIGLYSSSEYHTNNLLNPVYFEEAAKIIPDDAVVVEIAPHGLLQAIMTRSHKNCAHIPLTRRWHSKPVKFLLEAFGKLYQEGFHPNIDALYPTIDYPVSTETPFLSHLVHWNHIDDWPEAMFEIKDRIVAPSRDVILSIHDHDYKFLTAHSRNGQTVLIESALLFFIWETLAMFKGVNYRDLSVIFKNVQFHEEVVINAYESVALTMMICRGSNRFEISCENTVKVTGFITEVKSSSFQFRHIDPEESETNNLLKSEDVYKLLSLRGYEFRGGLRTIQSLNLTRDKAKIRQTDDWISYLDSLIQLNILSINHNGISILKFVTKLSIDPQYNINQSFSIKDSISCYNAQVFRTYDITRYAGVEIEHLLFENKPITQNEPELLKTVKYYPYILSGGVNIDMALHIILQIVMDNAVYNKIMLVNLYKENIKLMDEIKTVVKNMTDFAFIFDYTEKHCNYESSKQQQNTFVFIVEDLFKSEKKKAELKNTVATNSFILTWETSRSIDSKLKYFNTISTMRIQENVLILLKKIETISYPDVYVRIVDKPCFAWINEVQKEWCRSNRIFLVSEGNPDYGLIGLVKFLNKNYTKVARLSLVIVDANDNKELCFNPKIQIFEEQLKKNLTMNIFKNNQWGGYYYLPVSTNHGDLVLKCQKPTDFNSITWTKLLLPPDTKTLIKVCFVGIHLSNYEKDDAIMDNCSHIFDFSGTDAENTKVMGLIHGEIASCVNADKYLLWPIPDHWTFKESASVPLSYTLAYYCLGIRGELLRGQSVFVNEGTGEIGQAVISICLSLNCIVFTTVKNKESKTFLMKLFPQLKESHIDDSGTDNFYTMVLLETKTNKCNFVINCETGYLRKAAMKCVGFGGIFLDINCHDMRANNEIGMHYLDEYRTYRAIKLSTLFRSEYIGDRMKLQLMIANGIENGTVRPITQVTYPKKDIFKAINLISAGKHIGRVLIDMRSENIARHIINETSGIARLPNAICLIICDEKGIGIELVDHLIKRGVKTLVINCKAECMTGLIYEELSTLKDNGVTVKLHSNDLQYEENCINLITETCKLGPLRGIYIVLDDGQGTNKNGLKKEIFADCFAQTLSIPIRLDSLSRNYCNNLSEFVVIIKMQENVLNEYVQSVIQQMCECRNDIGLPALALRIPLMDQMTYSFLSTIFRAMDLSLGQKHSNVSMIDLKSQNTPNLMDVPKVQCLENVILKSFKQNLGTLADRKIPNKGFQNFFSSIDKDECMAIEPIILMETMLSSTDETNQELYPNTTPLILIPGFDGHYSIFKSLCKRLKIPAVTIQMGPDISYESYQIVTDNILKIMKNKFELKTKFYLFGYSFGVNIALKLAGLLESQGLSGIVYCLDSSPDTLRLKLDEYFGEISTGDFENRIIDNMYQLFTGEKNEELEQEVKDLKIWEEKIDKCVNHLKRKVTYTIQYTREVINSAYKKIILAKSNEPSCKLESEIILIRESLNSSETILADYGLSRFSKKAVRVFETEIYNVPNSKVPYIVNQTMGPDVFELFRRNQCNTYLANPFNKE